MKHIITSIALLLMAGSLKAQVTTRLPIDTAKQCKKNPTSLSIGSGGIQIKRDSSKYHGPFEVQIGMLDVGINSLVDNTNYATLNTTAPGLLQVDNAHQNADLFSLRQSKSINVNIYPIMVKARLLKTAHQKVILATGVGLQLYNFRFTKPISYYNEPTTHINLDTVSFSKNKLAMNYLTVPLMVLGKTRIAGDEAGKNSYWITYGVGVSAGYLLSSWTKQMSDERGKEKNHDQFNFRNTNVCVNGELGLDGYVRLYASYQLTALHENGLDQHPFSLGIRFLGL